MQTLTWSSGMFHILYKEKAMFAHFQSDCSFLVPVFHKPQGTSEIFMGTRKPLVSYLSNYYVSALE